MLFLKYKMRYEVPFEEDRWHLNSTSFLDPWEVYEINMISNATAK